MFGLLAVASSHLSLEFSQLFLPAQAMEPDGQQPPNEREVIGHTTYNLNGGVCQKKCATQNAVMQ